MGKYTPEQGLGEDRASHPPGTAAIVWEGNLVTSAEWPGEMPVLGS